MTPDSSVVIAGFATWNEHHQRARDALSKVADLVSHVELETLSSLTRMPAPFRAEPEVVAAYLGQFAGKRLALPERRRRTLVGRLVDAEISGGAVYDATIGLTADAYGHELVSLDRRASRTYAKLGIRFRLLA